MSSDFSDQMIGLPKGNLIKNPKLEGDQNMALDVLLLEELINTSKFSMAARFYKWEGNWLSLGHNQKTIPKKWIELAKLKKIKVVKRPSGGGAVLHSGGLTYSFLWESPPKNKHEAYFQTSEWLIESFSQLGLPLQFGNQPINRIPKNCFSTATSADLIDINGEKRVGSAQLWRKGRLLQHGEIVLNPQESLWREVFDTDPPKKHKLILNFDQIENSLINSLKKIWPEINWIERSITKEEIKKVKSKAKDYLFKSND